MSPTEIAELNARRAALALDATDGVPGAEEALGEIEEALRAAALDEERASIIEEERARREAVLAQRQADAAVAAAQAKMPVLAQQFAELGDRIQRALDDLREGITDFRALDQEMVITGRAAGTPMSDHRSAALKARILGEVASAFPHNFDYHFPNPTGETFAENHRRSLGLLETTETPEAAG